jgi:hypothetical protein
MEIFFDSALDGKAWPVWHGEKQGSAGKIHTGQLGLLNYLENLMGLRGPDTPEGVRVASLIPPLQKAERCFWSRSADVDPFGVARQLIHLNDFLVLHGWQGWGGSGSGSLRLADLASFSGEIMPGFAQRVQTVITKLENFDDELSQIIMLQDVKELPPLWQTLFCKLREKGADISPETIGPSSETENDLSNAKKGMFTPRCDDSLQMVRPDGILQAAEDVAAWLAAILEAEGLDDTVIIGGDEVLDQALQRYGVPVVGAVSKNGNALMELLPLVLAMGQTPPDPSRIMELLTLPVSPVPPGISRKLRQALGKWPALGSVLWEEKLEEGLAAIGDEVRRVKIAERLEVLFTPAMSEEYSVGEIEKRLDMLLKWLYSSFHDDPAAYPAINQCRMFLSMLEAMQVTRVDEPLLKRLIDEATASQALPAALQAQAGLSGVPVPEAVVGKARRIVWWNFTRGSVSALDLPLFSLEEQEALAESGVKLPDSAVIAGHRAARWQRPLDFAADQLILVCPRRDRLGEELHPHPLWDELLAASQEEANLLVGSGVRSKIAIPTITPEKLLLPRAEEQWQVESGAVRQREIESPSSLENLLGCSLKWCLSYVASIRRGNMTALPDLVPTLGSLAHELVEEVLSMEELPIPEVGAKMVEEIFDRKAPLMVAAIFQKGMEAEKEKIRNTIVLAMRSLLQHFHDAGVKKISIEEKLSGKFGEQQLQGYADIVVEKPFTVIDLKRSWAKIYKEKLHTGTALQIVIYGWLLKQAKGVFPELAYYTLEDQKFLTTDPLHFPDGEAVEMPPLTDIWEIFEKTYNEAWALLNDGIVLSPGNGEDEIKGRLEDDRLILEPPCRICDYGVLCGRGISK